MDTGLIEANGSVVVDAKGAFGTAGGFNTLYVNGTWGGGNIQVECSPDGSTWFTLAGATMSANGMMNVSARWRQVRLTLAGATNPSLSFWIL